jgi:hypothetical protein
MHVASCIVVVPSCNLLVSLISWKHHLVWHLDVKLKFGLALWDCSRCLQCRHVFVCKPYLGPLWEGFSRGFISSFTWSPPKRLFCGRLRSWSPSNHALWSRFAREEPQNTSFVRLHAAPASIWQPCPWGPSVQACGVGGGISRCRPPEVAHAAAVGPSSRTSRRHSLEARHRWRRGSRRQANLPARVSEDPDEEEAREGRGEEGRRLSASVRRWRAGGRRWGGISQGTATGSSRGAEVISNSSHGVGKKGSRKFILSICGAHND